MDVKLTFVIPIYNEEKRLERCIESILKQNNSSVEIICIDDNSSDHTNEILNNYKEKCENIKVFYNNQNRGAGYCKNIGIKNATGEYIWFVDADDYIHNMAIGRIITIATEKDLDVICFDLKRIDETGEYESYSLPVCKTEVMSGENLYIQIGMNRKTRASACTQVYKKQYLQSIDLKFAEGVMGEDANFSMQSLICARRTIYLREAYYIYHKSPISVSTITTEKDYFLGIFTAYCDMLYFWSRGNWSLDLSKYMTNFISRYYKIAKKHFHASDKRSIEAYIQQKGEYLQKQYQLFLANEFENSVLNNLDEDKIELIKKYEEVIVYGAGNVARDIAYIFDKLEKPIIAYAVSDDAENNPNSIYGVSVQKISSLEKYNNTALVVIATMPNKQKKIVEILQELGFRNYIYAIE